MRYDTASNSWYGSATDLANHARCTHLTHRTRERERAIALGEVDRPAREQTLAMRTGTEFEQRVVAQLRADVEAAGGRFLDLAEHDPSGRRDLLATAMRDGVELIAQAPLRSGSLFGYADLLERVDDAPAPAGRLATTHRYRPVEVKYARTPRPEHVMQAAAYADALAELQGELPPTIDVICGDGTRHAHRPADYLAYLHLARRRFDAALALPVEPELERVPDPVPHCDSCELLELCATRRREADHLALVARIRVDQRAKLAAVGIRTLTDLATVDDPDLSVPGIGRTALRQLRDQARLQLAARTAADQPPPIELRHPDPADPSRRGFALLPDPDPYDLYFDFEGYPFHESGEGLEYLWGWTSHDPSSPTLAPRFDHLWADTIEDEDRAFEAFLTEVEHRREASDERMHVYHYAPYETTALRRIARRRVEWMDRLDALLRSGTFVDLYAVVRQSMLIGVESYSIKQLERFYAHELRSGADLADGGASIEMYEQYVLTGDPSIRRTIVDYNRDDCDSTLALRDWLLTRRDEARAAGIQWPTPSPSDAGPSAGDDEASTADPREEPQAALLRRRLEAVADDESHPDDVRAAARLLAGMPGWGWRIKREFLGELHGAKHEREDADHVLAPDAIGELELVHELRDPPRTRAAGTVDRTFAYPPQVTLLKADEHALQAYDPHTATTVGTIRSIDPDARTLTVRSTPDQLARAEGRVPTSLVGYANIPHALLERTAMRVAESLLDALDSGRDPFAPGAPHAAALALLARRPPRTELHADDAELADLVASLDSSSFVVQGPPGTGKTWTSARLIAELVRRGMRVGLSSNSHEAIVTVLEELDAVRAADPAAFAVRAAYKPKREIAIDDPWLTVLRDNRDGRARIARGEVNLLAGTAWTFCDEDLHLDAMLVDEAGQVSLLGATAMAACADRVVLVGDPQQLPQPSSTKHPYGCDASVLELQFDGAAVLEPERALLLAETRRMHPDIARFISETYYDGRVVAHEGTRVQRVTCPMRPELPAAGTHFLPVEHAGNRVHAPEEVVAIQRLVHDLLAPGTRVVARPGEAERELTADDIVVVAPYNVQRRALQEALGPDVRVGTVDKFQGKEAAVAIVSMTASSRDELPRGLEFVLDPHRMNVAISRARALAVVVASPALLATDAANLREMRLLNDLARLAASSPEG